jgi:hypothetical protein
MHLFAASKSFEYSTTQALKSRAPMPITDFRFRKSNAQVLRSREGSAAGQRCELI